mgnify:CR=1 FL=1
MKHKLIRAVVALGLTAAAAPAFAHAGPAGHDFMHGLGHPLTGIDHFVAMLAVGLWAATRPSQSAWKAPVAFLACLTIGAVLGVAGGAVAMVEPVVASSIIALAAMLLLAPAVPDRGGLAIIGGFALFHGYAHGAEAAGGLTGYFAGFLLASALLHVAGWRIGTALFASRPARWASALGVGAVGLMLSFS